MNKIRISIGTYFQMPMSNMTPARYFDYLNTGGKITARSVLDLCTILVTYIEEQEKLNEQNEANFKEIQEILAKLVEKKVEKPNEEKNETVWMCPNCGKEVSTKLALAGHMRSHKTPPPAI